MPADSRSPEPDSDGVKVSETPGLRRAAWVLVVVTLVVGLGTFLVIMLIRRGGPESPAEVEATHRPEPTAAEDRMAPPAVAPARPSVSRPRAVRHAAAPSSTVPAAAPSEPSAARDVSAKDLIETMNAGGVHAGIAAFPPPGTKPVKRGIVVPEDFVLPEGFVRHYQTTDSGEQLAAILTLHPDYDLVDARGERIALPDDRVVPPELAPADLPVRILELPDSEAASGRKN